MATTSPPPPPTSTSTMPPTASPQSPGAAPAPAPAPAPEATPAPSGQPQPTTDPFDSLLTLEDDFYTEGYNQGMADGRMAGRTEGRQLGLERGFQKFVESGRLQGRAIVWANRLGGGRRRVSSRVVAAAGGKGEGGGDGDGDGDGDAPLGKGDGDGNGNGEEGLGGVDGGWDGVVRELPPLPHKDGGRLGKHISTLYALAETESLSTENNDDAVSDFDDRLRRAQGRAKVIERMVGEGGGEKKGSDEHGHDPGAGSGKGEGGIDI